jgi:hypothetical protein
MADVRIGVVWSVAISMSDVSEASFKIEVFDETSTLLIAHIHRMSSPNQLFPTEGVDGLLLDSIVNLIQMKLMKGIHSR